MLAQAVTWVYLVYSNLGVYVQIHLAPPMLGRTSTVQLKIFPTFFSFTETLCTNFNISAALTLEAN